MYPHGNEPRSVDRGEKAAGSAIEGEPSVLPRRALAESCQSLHVTPDRSGIRFMLLRECVRLAGLFLRQIESLDGRIKDRVACGTELLGDRSQESRLIVRGVGIEGGVDVVERRCPLLLNRCSDVAAPEAGHVLKSPNQMVSTHHPKEEHVECEGSGAHIAVPENESAEQTGV